MIRGALFDMDGLLLDSEVIYARCIRKIMQGMGFTITDDMLRRVLGVPRATSDRIFAEGNPGFDGDELWRRVGVWLAEHGYDRAIPLKLGAAEILEHLNDRGICCALVTSSSRRQAERFLTPHGIMKHFSAVVSGDTEMPGKPAPDVYLYAARLLGIDIHDCAVLEDSLNGLKAGHASGALTVMVPDLIPYGPETAPYCQLVAADLREAEAMLCR